MNVGKERETVEHLRGLSPEFVTNDGAIRGAEVLRSMRDEAEIMAAGIAEGGLSAKDLHLAQAVLADLLESIESVDALIAAAEDHRRAARLHRPACADSPPA